MQAAGEFMLSQILRVVFDLCPQINITEVKTKLSEIITGFCIKKADEQTDHQDLLDKIELFLSGKQLEGLSKVTLDGYEMHLRIFADHVKKRADSITTADIRVYLGRFKDQKITTISTKLSVLKSFFSWLTSEEIIQRDPTMKIKPPKKEKRLPKALTIEEFEMLRESCMTIRQRAMVEVFYATGGRLSEIQALDRNSIDWQNSSTRVVGKGNKEREVYFSFKAMYHLKKYLMTRLDDESALFITERKPYRRLSKRGIQREIGIIAEQAGLQKRVTPHTMRHTFATLTLNNGADIAVVQQLLGHEDPATTQIYAQVSESRKREQHKKYLVQ
ncbi:integrase [Paenibacillus albiflavus]|uniref:Integrase n=1 Tax=Paenibacillus albiflavus TaxID=2545760 RepID=A0A4R4EBN4_9BACL|nr:site-specific tyrosine recombinase/integron integrase [Paenibacillus albiflavus]TCZ75338.1 integrase [Paenibacillus albiflavus]